MYFFPRGALQYQTSSRSLKLSRALSLCHKHDKLGLSCDKYSSKVFTGQYGLFGLSYIRPSPGESSGWYFPLWFLSSSSSAWYTQPRSQGSLLLAQRSVGREGENPGNEVVIYVLLTSCISLHGFVRGRRVFLPRWIRWTRWNMRLNQTTCLRDLDLERMDCSKTEFFSRSSFDIGLWWSTLPNPCRFNHRAPRITTAYWKPNYKDLYGNLSYDR